MNKHTLTTKRTSGLALRLALLDKLSVALYAVFRLVTLSTRHTIPAERLLSNTTHCLSIGVLAANLQVGADVIFITFGQKLLDLVSKGIEFGGFATERATSGALRLAFFDVLGVAVERLFLRVAHLAGEALTAEVLLADVTDDFAIFDALDGETGADVSVVVAGGSGEPVRESQDAWGGREGNLDRDCDGVIIGVEGERGGVGGASEKRCRDEEERGAAELHL